MKYNQKLDSLRRILQIFDRDKNLEIKNIKRINQMIEAKMVSVGRLTAYKMEYINRSNDSASVKIPVLMKNTEDFIKKLDNAIDEENRIADVYNHEKVASIVKMEELIQKILVIENKIGYYTQIIEQYEDEIICVELNEIAVTKSMKD